MVHTVLDWSRRFSGEHKTALQNVCSRTKAEAKSELRTGLGICTCHYLGHCGCASSEPVRPEQLIRRVAFCMPLWSYPVRLQPAY